jgi:hydrogenase expression/formation protein HypC
MCLGIPGRLVQTLEPMGGVALGLVEFVCTECVPDAVPGDYVIVHAGIAISRIDADEAERLLRELAELGESAAGASIADMQT